MSRAHQGGYHVIEIDALRREINPYYDRIAYRQLLKHFSNLKPEIMHSHSSKAGILARKAAAKLGGIKIVHTIHGLPYHPYQSWWLNRLYIALEKRAAKRSDALISVADAMTRQALSAGVGKPQQYTTIYSGMEVQPFIEHSKWADEFRLALNLPDQAVLVTQVSRLAELKGHEFILAAAKRIDNSRIHFCLVGDGHWRHRIEAEISQRGLAGRFHLTGLLPPDRIAAVMQASDILIHCSLREGLARTLPQAMLAGKPVISFDIDGAREVVDSETGVLLEPKDVAGLTLAIETLADSSELRKRLGEGGRNRCLEKFNHNRMVEQIEEVYRQIL